jgi:hypothetical protein
VSDITDLPVKVREYQKCVDRCLWHHFLRTSKQQNRLTLAGLEYMTAERSHHVNTLYPQERLEFTRLRREKGCRHPAHSQMLYASLVPTPEQMAAADSLDLSVPLSIAPASVSSAVRRGAAAAAAPPPPPPPPPAGVDAGHGFFERSELRRGVAPTTQQREDESSQETYSRHLRSVLGSLLTDGSRNASQATAEIHCQFCHKLWAALEDAKLAEVAGSDGEDARREGAHLRQLV